MLLYLIQIPIYPLVLFGCLIAVPTLSGAPLDTEAPEHLFALKVKPLLASKCWSCHGQDPDEIEAGLNLMSRMDMLKGSKFDDRIVVPGDAEESFLYAAIRWLEPDAEMPPKENDRLTQEEIWYFRDWINAGAPWPDDATVAAIRDEHQQGIRVKTSGGLSDEWDQRPYEEENLWAYQPLAKVDPPAPGHPVDAFINQQLDERGIEPAPTANRSSFIRRVTYDLTGLPPAPEAVQAFVEDPSDDDAAYQRVLDDLFASPQYGEKMAQHWLDVVRYADSAGLANDYVRGSAWRYRDYVVRSFNQKKPYDRFIREQLAGDELYPDEPEPLVAVGMLRMGPWELTTMEVPRVARQRFLDDVTESIGQTVLAHPMSCASCHDHKFDPVPTRDYYAMQAVFATTQPAEREVPFLNLENLAGFDEKEIFLRQKERSQETLAEMAALEEANARRWAEEQNLPYIPRNEGLKLGIPEDQLPPKFVGFTTEQHGVRSIAGKWVQRLSWVFDRYAPFAHSVYSGMTPELKSITTPFRIPENTETEGELEQSQILAGGDPFSPIEPVVPGPLSALNAFNYGLEEIRFPQSISGRRSALAEWLTHPENPLTPRVMVNRIWQWHFGQGIAGNPNNLGATGKKPTHPELLDWLSAQFIEQGWSIQDIQRLILTSEAYRRSASHPNPQQLKEQDPEGNSYAVFHPRRLTAEELRDSMLFVSGELNQEVGGIPARPEINLEAAMQARLVMGTTASAWQPSLTPEQRHRRSLYTLRLRGLRNPFFETFNAPSPDASCESRDASNVTPQVFSLMNSEDSYGRAVAFAERLLKENKDRPEIVRQAFALAFGRRPAPDEIELGLAHWAAMEKRHEHMTIPRKNYPTQITREAVEENTGKKFTFTEILDFYAEMERDREMADLDPSARALADLCLVLFNSNEFTYLY